jgi:pimeloyl-ACP methyl ester carboxylesterase
MTKPDKGEYLDVDGIRTFYIKEGSGHPLLLIHGGAPGACSLVTWKPNIEYFASSGFTVYAFDQPGYGYTDNPTDYSLEYRAAHAKSFIDKLGLDRFHMIAQSRGAYIAMKLALEDRRTGRLVSTASGTVAPKGSAESGALSKKHEAELRAYTPSLENIRTITKKTLFHQELVTEELVKARYEMSTGKNYEANLKRREAPPPKPITEELRNLKVKTLLVWGKYDQGVTLERALLLFQLIPDAELHVFDKSGHWTQWDQTSRFNRIVCDFLKD